jgi:hypothetical protein
MGLGSPAPLATGRVHTALGASCAALQLQLVGGVASGDGPDAQAPTDLAGPADFAIPVDAGEPTDAAAPSDLAAPVDSGWPSDFAEPADLAPLADLYRPVDLAPPVDLALPVDLARPVDLLLPVDLSTPPDLAVSTVTFTGNGNTVRTQGTSTSPPADDACPAGQALIGFGGFVFVYADGTQNFLSEIWGVCGVASLVPTGAGYEIHTSPGTTLPVRGGPTTPLQFSYPCPANQFVIGYHGRSGAYVDQLVFQCAPLVVAPNLSVSLGAALAGGTLGGNGGGPFPQTNCPTGQVATTVHTRALAASPIDDFSLGCATPILK